MEKKRVLAVIPARGGSKGIPKKNIRLLNGKPLIAYAIDNAIRCHLIDDVVVSTDSEEIAYIAESCGANVLMRGTGLSEDSVTLDPVVFDALTRFEKERDHTYDYVVTMQPTSPLLKTDSLTAAIDRIIDEGHDCIISVVNDPRLMWKKEGTVISPCYEKRLNRQQLPPMYDETGGFVISGRDIVTPDSRISGDVAVFEIRPEESIDIDTYEDWILCEAVLKRKRVLFRMDGYDRLGMGHVYNCITLALSMMEHEVLLVINERSVEGIKKVKETNLPYRVLGSDDEIYEIIDEFRPDIWVNDMLNTEKEYIRELKRRIPRVVTIEDLGEGTQLADAVINALYTDDDISGSNIYNGWKYVCLRDEFQIENPGPFSDTVKNVLLMFGGTDPGNYNKMLYDIVLRMAPRYPQISFNFVVGIGYDADKNGLVSVEGKNVFVYSNVQRVTQFMREADIAITSQGRTIFELASMRVPSIVLSQNQREQMHSFANMQNGFINLGLGRDIRQDVIENTLRWLIETGVVRKNMYSIMAHFRLKDGLERVKRIILDDDNTQT